MVVGEPKFSRRVEEIFTGSFPSERVKKNPFRKSKKNLYRKSLQENQNAAVKVRCETP